MPANLLKIIVAGGLFLHGIAYGVALIAVLRQSLAGPPTPAPAVRAWLNPRLGPKIAAGLALPFWAVATTCFLVASLSFWGALPAPGWRQTAVAGAIIGLLGIALFPAPWPGSPNIKRSLLNTSIALVVNVVILASQLWFRWPPITVFGR
jgi:hypothetical protein